MKKFSNIFQNFSILRARIGRRLLISYVLLVLILVGGSGTVLFVLTLRSLEMQMRSHLISMAQLVGASISGDVLGVLGPGWERSRVSHRLTEKLSRAKNFSGARRVYLFDRLGRSLIDTDGTPIGQHLHHLRVRDRSEVEQVLGGESSCSILFFTEDGTPYMSGYAPIFFGDDIVAAVGMDIGVGFIDSIRLFKRSILVFALVSAFLALIVAWAMARTFTKPINLLVGAARKIGSGHLEQTVPSIGDDEIGYLADSMDEMRGRLLTRDTQLRQMLGGVAHEIRNPLGGIEIYAGIIADDLPDGDQRKQHILKVIKEVRKLDNVISDFLTFARPSAPEFDFVNLDSVVKDALFLLLPNTSCSDVDAEIKVDCEILVWIDREQIKRALLNLMKNAIQAMPDGGLLRVSAGRNNDQIWIEVSDNGCGISEEVRERLFDPFFTTREKGSGLGLAIVAKTVRDNGGSFVLHSTDSTGTSFRIYLPYKEPAGKDKMT